MKTNANAIKIGNIIDHQGKLWRVVKRDHTMPGKGGAFIQMELKEVKSGSKLNERFRSNEDVMVARLDEKQYQYLFADGDMLTVMDTESYDQITVNKDLLGEQAAFLQDGMMITLLSHEGEVLGASVPEQVTLEVTETEAVVKGQTAASSNKPAVLENGVRVMVPPFINIGDRIVVKTTDVSYVERAK